MRLTSAVALARSRLDRSDATSKTRRSDVRPLSDEFIDAYLDAEWPEVGHCVGVLSLRRAAASSFSSMSNGDYFTILGMPLLPLLGVFAASGRSFRHDTDRAYRLDWDGQVDRRTRCSNERAFPSSMPTPRCAGCRAGWAVGRAHRARVSRNCTRGNSRSSASSRCRTR